MQTGVVASQDSDDSANSPVSRKWQTALGGFSRAQREALLASGMPENVLDEAERGMVTHAEVATLMSRGPTLQGAAMMSRGQTLQGPAVMSEAPALQGAALMTQDLSEQGTTRPGLMSRNNTAASYPAKVIALDMVDVGTPPIFKIEGLVDSGLLPKSESGNVHVGHGC
jgi:hypothetical protein